MTTRRITRSSAPTVVVIKITRRADLGGRPVFRPFSWQPFVFSLSPGNASRFRPPTYSTHNIYTVRRDTRRPATHPIWHRTDVPNGGTHTTKRFCFRRTRLRQSSSAGGHKRAYNNNKQYALLPTFFLYCLPPAPRSCTISATSFVTYHIFRNDKFKRCFVFIARSNRMAHVHRKPTIAVFLRRPPHTFRLVLRPRSGSRLFPSFP